MQAVVTRAGRTGPGRVYCHTVRTKRALYLSTCCATFQTTLVTDCAPSQKWRAKIDEMRHKERSQHCVSSFVVDQWRTVTQLFQIPVRENAQQCAFTVAVKYYHAEQHSDEEMSAVTLHFFAVTLTNLMYNEKLERRMTGLVII